MATKELPSQDMLRQILRYEPDTGRLFWLPRDASWFESNDRYSAEALSRIFNGRNAGREAFTASDHKGYLQGQVLKYHTFAHRVIWALVHGEWPKAIDHINGDGRDNRIANLRAVSHKENCRNMATPNNNTSGSMGVRYRDRFGRWEAYITLSGKQIYLGMFPTRAEAVAAREKAQAANGFHANHGRTQVAGMGRKRGGVEQAIKAPARV